MLLANGEPFTLKCATWYGAESRVGPPYGLDKHTADHYFAFLQANRFNTVRIPFCHGTVIKNEYIWMTKDTVNVRACRSANIRHVLSQVHTLPVGLHQLPCVHSGSPLAP